MHLQSLLRGGHRGPVGSILQVQQWRAVPTAGDLREKPVLDGIVYKYIEMNMAHPFIEGNGRSARIWLDLMLKKRLALCIDWSKIGKSDYLNAMIESEMDGSKIRELLHQALTDQIDDRETFMKGIDYSYYYEQEE